MSDRAVSVASLSKAYGLPGLRVGWLVCRDTALLETLLAAKEQIFICGATLDEEIGAAVLGAARPRSCRPSSTERRTTAGSSPSGSRGEPLIDWVAPAGGVVCFPRVRADVDFDADEFHRRLLADYGTYVGPGHWFEADDRHMRIGYGWPTTDELRAGLPAYPAALAPDGRRRRDDVVTSTRRLVVGLSSHCAARLVQRQW